MPGTVDERKVQEAFEAYRAWASAGGRSAALWERYACRAVALSDEEYARVVGLMPPCAPASPRGPGTRRPDLPLGGG